MQQSRRSFLTGVVGTSMLFAVVGLSYRFATHDASATATTTLPFPVTALSATATDSSDGYVVATGAIDEDKEGLYLLNPATGRLQCWVVNRLAPARVVGFARDGVLEDVGAADSKNPRLLVVTGLYDAPPAAAGGVRVGDSVVYVVNAASGQFAVYGVPWPPVGAGAHGGSMNRYLTGRAIEGPIR